MPAPKNSAGHGDGGVVLLPGVKVVGKKVIHFDAVELRGGLVHLSGPRFPAIESDIAAAVIGIGHVEGIVGIDPKRMIIAVGRGKSLEGAAAIDGFFDRRVDHVNNVGVLEVGRNHGVIPSTGACDAVFGNAVPGFSSIIGPV